MLRSELTWFSPQNRLPAGADGDEFGYVLIAMSDSRKPIIRVARFDGKVWIDFANFVVHQVHCWAAMPALELTRDDYLPALPAEVR
jgi:hypothetical protein